MSAVSTAPPATDADVIVVGAGMGGLVVAHDLARAGYDVIVVDAASEVGGLLRREGEPSGINRIYRLYREEGLTVRKRRARRRAVGTRAPILRGSAECTLVTRLRARPVRLRAALSRAQYRR